MYSISFKPYVASIADAIASRISAAKGRLAGALPRIPTIHPITWTKAQWLDYQRPSVITDIEGRLKKWDLYEKKLSDNSTVAEKEKVIHSALSKLTPVDLRKISSSLKTDPYIRNLLLQAQTVKEVETILRAATKQKSFQQIKANSERVKKILGDAINKSALYQHDYEFLAYANENCIKTYSEFLIERIKIKIKIADANDPKNKPLVSAHDEAVAYMADFPKGSTSTAIFNLLFRTVIGGNHQHIGCAMAYVAQLDNVPPSFKGRLHPFCEPMQKNGFHYEFKELKSGSVSILISNPNNMEVRNCEMPMPKEIEMQEEIFYYAHNRPRETGEKLKQESGTKLETELTKERKQKARSFIHQMENQVLAAFSDLMGTKKNNPKLTLKAAIQSGNVWLHKDAVSGGERLSLTPSHSSLPIIGVNASTVEQIRDVIAGSTENKTVDFLKSEINLQIGVSAKEVPEKVFGEGEKWERHIELTFKADGREYKTYYTLESHGKTKARNELANELYFSRKLESDFLMSVSYFMRNRGS